MAEHLIIEMFGNQPGEKFELWLTTEGVDPDERVIAIRTVNRTRQRGKARMQHLGALHESIAPTQLREQDRDITRTFAEARRVRLDECSFNASWPV